ncbi:unnamed protein product [Somion occarium]|uniref:Cation/H+ exchanger domain-containing protein n=1 Tax=Somion occarium TaxID=3059160 RepID=A0ABP1EAV4_9APHY
MNRLLDKPPLATSKSSHSCSGLSDSFVVITRITPHYGRNVLIFLLYFISHYYLGCLPILSTSTDGVADPVILHLPPQSCQSRGRLLPPCRNRGHDMSWNDIWRTVSGDFAPGLGGYVHRAGISRLDRDRFRRRPIDKPSSTSVEPSAFLVVCSSFAAGAALSSTSLGTTLVALRNVSQTSANSLVPPTQLISSEGPNDGVLLPPTSVVARNKDSSAVSVSSAGAAMNVPLQQTRIGTILISAAVIDDVIGLVLAAMIPELSALNNGDSHSNLIWTIIHPLVFSFLITVVTPLVARYLLRPIFWFRGFGEQWCAPVCPGKRWGARIFFGISSENPRSSGWGTEAHADAAKLFLMVGFVSAFSAIAHYTGSSVLFGAYLAGCVLRYISRPSDIKIEDLSPQGSDNIEVIVKRRLKQLSFEETFIRIVGPIQQYVFAPLFFASIGYAIPFISLWRPKVFWRGMLYSLLMAVGKLAVGLPILASTIWPPDPNITQPGENSGGFWASHVHRTLACFSRERTVHPTPHNRHEDIELPRLTSTRPLPTSPSPVSLTVSNDGVSQQTLSPALPVHLRPPFVTRLKLSLAPAFFIGSAMIARGEIGLLIAQIARNGSKAGSNAGGALLGEEAFLVCIWAILLCTLVGPIGVGFVVRWWGPFVSRGIWH